MAQSDLIKDSVTMLFLGVVIGFFACFTHYKIVGPPSKSKKVKKTAEKTSDEEKKLNDELMAYDGNSKKSNSSAEEGEEGWESEDSMDSGATLDSVGKMIKKRNNTPVLIADEFMFEKHPINNTQMVLVVRDDLKKSEVGKECAKASIEVFKTCWRMTVKSTYWKQALENWQKNGKK